MSEPDSARLEAFRRDARAWLEANLPHALRNRPELVSTIRDELTPPGDMTLWKDRVAAKGWGMPTWPEHYGGGGLSGVEAGILKEEMARIGGYNPVLVSVGATMVGPTVLEYGTEAQKRQHLPPIARGETRWCLGYSEPNAGSDLASLQTRADDAGDHWIVNGQKLWTSGATLAEWCGCLVRTSNTGTKHDGITFMLIEMRQPGVEVRPIKLINGASPFCEVFFTDACAGQDGVLGAVGKGWAIGKRLLQHERSSQTEARAASPAPIQELAKSYVGLDDDGRLADPDLRMRIAAHLIDAKAHQLTLKRLAAAAKGASGATTAASVLKNSQTGIAQTRAELLLELRGNRGLGWEGDGFTDGDIADTRAWLYSKAMSIYGGSVEIQNNIISKRILELPDSAAGPRD